MRDYRRLGEELGSRFDGGKEATLWYYRALVDAFGGAAHSELIDELNRVVTELEGLVTTKPKVP